MFINGFMTSSSKRTAASFLAPELMRPAAVLLLSTAGCSQVRWLAFYLASHVAMVCASDGENDPSSWQHRLDLLIQSCMPNASPSFQLGLSSDPVFKGSAGINDCDIHELLSSC